MALYSVHFIIFIHVTMLVDISNCFDNRTKCQLCDDNNTTICWDLNIKNKPPDTECHNRYKSFKYLSNQPTRSNNSTRLYLEFAENLPLIDMKLFPNVTILKIRADKLDFNKLKGLSNVTVLDLTSNSILAIKNLTKFENLRILDLSHNVIENMSAIVIPSKLETLNLSSNNINIEDNITFPEALKTLNLSNNSIRSVKNFTFTGLLQKLDLRGNKITIVKPFTNLATLQELYLSNNNISRLDDGAFATLSSLVRLDLSGNKLISLGERCFAGLNRLQHLDISENAVFSVKPGTFQYLTNLIELKLSGNTNLGKYEKPNKDDNSLLLGTGQRLQTIEASRTNLTKIPSTLTRSVRTLHLSENSISYLRCGDLDSYPLLKTLNLTDNRIEDIEDDALGRLEFLNYLLLSGNLLKTIPHSLPDNLCVLDLNGNKIEELTMNDFVGLSNLQKLVLRKNKIKRISDGTFGQLSSLQVLDLSGNPITVLSSNTFVGPRQLKQLILTSLVDLIPRTELLSFPVPESGHLQLLNLSSSPILVNQLLDDIAALATFKQLTTLDISYGNVTNIRLDLDRYLPRLKLLILSGNKFNCTENILSLANRLLKLQQDCDMLTNEDKDRDDDEESYQHLWNSDTRASAQSDKEKQFRIRSCEHCFSAPLCYTPDKLYGRPLCSLKTEDFYEVTVSTPSTMSATTSITTITTPTLSSTTTTTTTTRIPLPSSTNVPTTAVTSEIPTAQSGSYQQTTLTDHDNKQDTLKAQRKQSDTNNFMTFTLPVTSQQTTTAISNESSLLGDATTFPSAYNYTNKYNKNTKTELPESYKTNQHDNTHLKEQHDEATANKTEHEFLYNTNNTDNTDNRTSELASEEERDSVMMKQSYENITGQIKNDAYLAAKEDVKKTNISSKSHPGMFVFLSILSVILLASVIMMSSHLRQYRQRLELTRGYLPQQDIEVRSLSSVGGYDLW